MTKQTTGNGANDGEWHQAVGDVKPLRKRTLAPRKLSDEELARKPIKPKAEPAPPRAPARAAYDAKIDLHGLTESGAYPLLMDFVERERRRGARSLLVITGKGSGKSAGVLRANVPRWLDVEPIARYISAIELAPANLGGDGALLVRLKKPK